jgi:hypothetical protein
MKTNPLYFLTILAAAFLLVACSEEEVAVPQVVITAPPGGSSYAFGDTLVLEFSAKPADRVRYFLRQKNGAFSLNGRLVDKVADSYTVEYYLNDKYMPTGQYEVVAAADNQSESKRESRTVNYQELPLATNGLVAVGNSTLYEQDSTGAVNSVPLGANYTWVEVLSGAKEIFLGSQTSPFIATFRFTSLSPYYTISGPNPFGANQFYQIVEFNKAVYTLRADGFISSYEKGNDLKVSYEMQEAVPKQAAFIGERMAVVSQVGLAGNQHELRILNEDFLGAAQNYFIGPHDFKLCAFGPQKDQVALFVLDGGVELVTYNLTTQTPTSRFSLPGEVFYDCETLPSGEVIFSTNQGTYTYSINVSGKPTKVLTFGAQDIEINEVTQAVWLLNNGLVQALNSAGNLIYVAGVPGATQFEIVYNK